MSRSRRLALPLLLLALPLTGCGAGLTRLQMVDRPPPAGLTEPCARHPLPPERVSNDAELGVYMVTLAEAGEDCRIKHGCLARWAKGEAVDGDARCVGEPKP